jgi:predicted outer membrane protein
MPRGWMLSSSNPPIATPSRYTSPGRLGCTWSQGDEATPPDTAALSEGQLVHVLDTIDSDQIAQARVATLRASELSVRELARRMQTEHQESKEVTLEIARTSGFIPQRSEPSEQLEASASQTLALLERSDAARIDATYLKAAIDRHTALLHFLQRDLLPSVRGATMAARLGGEQLLLQDHLVRCQQLYAVVSPITQPAQSLY